MRFIFRTALLCALSGASLMCANDELTARFQNPPDSAKPWVYSFWVNGNMTREGITADLEALQRVGIGGAVLMEIDSFIPAGPVRFFSPEWRALWQHAMKEATRLGITISMNNDAGWMGSGGPWVTPELSMQMTVASEMRVIGGRRISVVLPQPKTNEGYYRDIAVLAFPTPRDEAARMLAAQPKMTVDSRPLDAAKLADGNTATAEELPQHAAGQAWVVNIEFPKVFTARALTVALDRPLSAAHGVIESSEDGQTYKLVREFDARWPLATLNFPAVAARHYRVRFMQDGRTPATLPLAELELNGGARIEALTGKAAYVAETSLPASTPAGSEIARGTVIDISTHMNAAGQLNWDAPRGEWTLLRIGHTSTGKRNHPAPKDGIGLECDKLSKAALDLHFNALMTKLIGDERAVGATAMKFAHIDSWESGSQNWTAAFRDEFRRRRGYDLTPYLPVLLGRVVDGPEQSERFLWDVRRTVADLITDNYAEHFRELSHKSGVQFSLEGYGAALLDELAYTGRADLPITEFWMGVPAGGGVKTTASAAHTYGKSVIAAEAFTSRAPAGRWQNHPYRLKPLGDEMFTRGVNRFIFHRFISQPWLNRPPGMSMGPYGVEFDRTATWWEQSKAYITYLTRCQYLLQQGRFVADVAYLDGENVGRDFQAPLDVHLPEGYDFDVVSSELLDQMTVRDGRLALPSGMTYRVLALPAGNTMRVERLRKIRSLVEAGATVVGAPPVASPSLADYGAGDAEIRRMTKEMWGECDGVNRVENRFGRGRVVWGKPVETLLAGPDFTALGGHAHYIHRTVEGREVYFVASADSDAKTLLCTFRVAGMRPALWWPDSGRMDRISVYERQAGVTRVPIQLDPYGSVFAVFEKDEGDDPVVSVTRNHVELSGLGATSVTDMDRALNGVRVGDGELEAAVAGAYEALTASGKRWRAVVDELPAAVEIAGPWTLSFPAGWGAPPQVTLDRLISWPEHADNGVRYFSGTATYRRAISIPAGMLGAGRALYLDLGRVSVIAEVKLNGKDLGILWKPPFRVEITDAAQAGDNTLEVRVTNLWPNRLIGDEQLPADMEWAGPRLVKWPEWLLAGRPSPTGRFTTITRRHWNKDDPLMESGLLGPVRLAPAVRTVFSK